MSEEETCVYLERASSLFWRTVDPCFFIGMSLLLAHFSCLLFCRIVLFHIRTIYTPRVTQDEEAGGIIRDEASLLFFPLSVVLPCRRRLPGIIQTWKERERERERIEKGWKMGKKSGNEEETMWMGKG